MAKIKIRYFVAKPGRGGRARHFWQPSKSLRAAGWRARRLADDRATAIDQAEKLNAELDRWRAGAEIDARHIRPGSVAELIRRYKRSRFWNDLRPASRKTYGHCLRMIEEWAGDAPVAGIQPPAVQALYESLRARTPSLAVLAVRVLHILLQFAVREGDIAANPAARPGIRNAQPTGGRIWRPADIDAFVAQADGMGWHSIGTAVIVNHWIGQRPKDIRELPRAAWRDGAFSIEQSKTGARVRIPHSPRVAQRVEAELARQTARRLAGQTLLLREDTGQPWTEAAFHRAFTEIRDAAAKDCPTLAGLHFRQLRHTAVTELAEAGCEIPEIATVTGHSLRSIMQILERYLIRTEKLAAGAAAKRLAAQGAAPADSD